MSWIKFIVQLPFFWLLLSSIFTIIFYKRGRGLGFYLSILLTGFWLVSMTPMGASLWFSSLTVFVKDSDTACRGEIKAVIVMPGGLSRRKEHSNNRLSVWSVNRANTALSLMGNGAVNTVIIPGGHHARDGKLEADVIQGFFQQRISGINYILGSRSNTTYENLLSLKSVVDDKQYYYLVTSYWHMPRVIKSARKIGLKICPVETPKLFSSSVIPTLEAHWKTKAAIHEWIALLWYWLSNRI